MSGITTGIFIFVSIETMIISLKTYSFLQVHVLREVAGLAQEKLGVRQIVGSVHSFLFVEVNSVEHLLKLKFRK